MDKIKKFLTDNSIVVIVTLFILLVLSNCSSNRSNDKLKDELKEVRVELDSVQTILNNSTTIEQVKIENAKLLYNFLIFEDDLDKKKISMSEIKLKVEELNK